ncbi:aminoglycoside phosphotransferase family protein [Carnimonas bestiolae]|uniref:aminoglycoside phosphotransferase family protein n=1 Tax=Carnimonas bestiolae TaxID=3402172 RepID=UPI003EDC52A3
MSDRFKALTQWIAQRHALDEQQCSLTAVADDASFRRYYRLTLDNGSRIIMDAPPEKEPSRSFVDIALAWGKQQLPVPALYAADLSRGFIELEDLGGTLLTDHLTPLDKAQRIKWLERAMTLSARIAAQPAQALPPYNTQRLGMELDLFPQWALERWLGIAAPPQWQQQRDTLIHQVLSQPQVTTHRDFHCGNLMVDAQQRLRVIDFQGAWHGAIGYDPGSLLRDRNAPWDDEIQRHVFQHHHQAALAAGITQQHSLEQYLSWIDEASAQRSLKVLGLFCRLAQRDGKPRYLLNYEHFFLAHLKQALSAMVARGDANATLWEGLLAWLESEFEPALIDALARLKEQQQ